ncbi:MAG: hydantoinase B/oxoprolinase family protein [Actinomycetota bacterium]
MSGPGTEAVRIAVVQARLDHLCRRMGWVMTRTARSPIFSQSHDFSCFATDRNGVLVSTADGIPIHTGGGGFAVRAILDRHDPDDPVGGIADGDVFLLNDPYTAGGNHLPDWVVARPVFVDGRLVAFCCNRAHQSDIGGGAAGTYNPEATEIYHEGLRLPVLRLIERGRVREDLWELLLLNSRTPDLLDGDLRAMLGSTAIGAGQVADLMVDLAGGVVAGSGGEQGRLAGLDGAIDALEAVCDHAEARFRARIAELPDGTWEATEHWDDDCFGPADVTIRLALTISGDEITVDFAGTDPQVRGFKNSGWVNTWSAVSMGLASYFEPDLPRNEGTFRGVTMRAPEGSVVNARPPAPMTMNTVIPAHEIVHLVWRCLAEAEPERSLAGWGKNIFPVTAGRGSGDGASDQKPFVMYHWSAAAGGGATGDRDGFNQIGHLIALGGLTLADVETAEQSYPVRFRRQEFRTDGGGAGRFRGGTGIEYEIDVDAPARWSFRGEGIGRPTGWGIDGGGDGAGGELVLRPHDGSKEIVAPKYGLVETGPARLVARSPGGGGWGDPLDRSPDLVARDVLDGVVSEEQARSRYGWDGQPPADAGGTGDPDQPADDRPEP